MNNILKLVVPWTSVRLVQHSIFTRHSKLITPTVTYISVRAMAQRTITSFFKVSPPKPAVKQEKNQEEEVSGDDKVDSPVTNGKSEVIS